MAWEEGPPEVDLGKPLSMHPRSQDHPATYVPQPLCLPPYGLAPLYIDFCPGDLGGGGQALGSGAAGAGPQPSRSLLCREGGDRIKLQLAWWTALPRQSCSQSPVFLRDVPGAEKRPTKVCLQRQDMELLSFSNVHHPAPLLLAFPSSPRTTAWLGLWTFFPMDPE